MGTKDYYKILGVQESASAADIKSNYRKLAKQYHPDANPGNKQAEDRFKEISEAYDVLSNEQKRQKYDQMRRFGGGSGFDFNNMDFGGFQNARGRSKGGRTSFDGYDIFGGLGDIFSQFFEQGSPFQSQKPQKGQDIHVDVKIPFLTALHGGEVTFSVNKEKTCPSCGGGGAKPGSRVVKCPTCGGKGHVSVLQGGFGVSRPCPRCHGKGQTIENPCDRCKGKGRVNGQRSYTVKVAPGTENEKVIRLKKEGRFGDEGMPPGDMLVKFLVESHNFFTKEGNDIACSIRLKLKQAMQGTVVRVKTVDGKKVQLKIAPGTRNGTVLRIPGMGLEHNGRRGDQFVTIEVQVPENPTPEEREYLKKTA